ncbi:hypothetical protein [Bosea sp. NBC_00550]|uniref:hypothetical protein n=1 Tax=Bosea sp. NBC_00550 TaxID=2969621 RepID=UPI0022311393|nr:hypothetical protein [Bosea sp. NBC_00550]UZF94649.1 hypothetical protein NWE53_10940 [Bosea sp. NBC_00550]
MTLGVVATAVGLYIAATAWARFPLPREQLSVAGHVGPISIDTPLVQEGTGRNQGSYRTQRIALVATGHPLKTYSPARTLWSRIPIASAGASHCTSSSIPTGA